MAKKKTQIPKYGTITLKGIQYYRTRITDADGQELSLYAATCEELYEKQLEARKQVEEIIFHRQHPTVAEYGEKWLLMQSVHVRATTLTDYTSKVRRHIIAELGDKRMGEVSLDDIQLALVPVSKKSASVYKSSVLNRRFFTVKNEQLLFRHSSYKLAVICFMIKICRRIWVCIHSLLRLSKRLRQTVNTFCLS